MATKVLLVLLLAVVHQVVSRQAGPPPQGIYQLEPEQQRCFKDFPVKVDDIVAFDTNKIAPTGNAQFNSFFACYYKNKGWQDEDGNVIFEQFTKDAPKHYKFGPVYHFIDETVSRLVHDAINKCRVNYAKGEDDGETAINWHNCVAKDFHAELRDIVAHIGVAPNPEY